MRKIGFFGITIALFSLVFGVVAVDAASSDTASAPQSTPGAAPFRFSMVRSAGATSAGCISGAAAAVTITPQGANDQMLVRVSHLPANTGFALFVIQLPNAPFGVAWYQGDLDTDAAGNGAVIVRGIFNEETFSLSLGGPANVVFRPTHQFHLGLWFADPAEARRAGCPSTVTPFDGDQRAGIQALSTRNYPVNRGPLALVPA
jgi:hypothetical protein